MSLHGFSMRPGQDAYNRMAASLMTDRLADRGIVAPEDR